MCEGVKREGERRGGSLKRKASEVERRSSTTKRLEEKSEGEEQKRKPRLSFRR